MLHNNRFTWEYPLPHCIGLLRLVTLGRLLHIAVHPTISQGGTITHPIIPYLHGGGAISFSCYKAKPHSQAQCVAIPLLCGADICGSRYHRH